MPEQPILQSPSPLVKLAVVSSLSYREQQQYHRFDGTPRAPRSSRRTKHRDLGRSAANAALIQLGMKVPPYIPTGERGMPVWPHGVVGSISHTDDIGVSAVAWRWQFRSVGIDVQPFRPLKRDISLRICCGTERKWALRKESSAETRLLLLFSAKESIFKALYPLTRKYFGFQAVELEWNDQDSGFKAVLAVDLSPEFRSGFSFSVGVQRVSGRDGGPDMAFTSVIMPSARPAEENAGTTERPR